MISEGQIRLEKIDPGLEIPEDIEDRLQKTSSTAGGGRVSSDEKKVEQAQEVILKAQAAPGTNSPEVLNLQRLAQNLTKENKSLKDENRILKEKLEQIRKIA